ncbi:MAG: hypothetical protein LBT51_09585, partial [Fusobacteriaceae bacterium]|nr:hypothetical protein [Fusobacteriaceae bacterium]
GEKKTSEELGFNTDIDKAQVITKDEEQYVVGDLHTDLLNKFERDKIKEAGPKIGDLAKAITDTREGGIGNTYKENRQSRLLDEYAEKNKDKLNMLGDPSIDDYTKVLIANAYFAEFFNGLVYKGSMPVIVIGDESYARDSKSGLSEVISISRDDLTGDNIAAILAHELGHLNTYDTGEETASSFENRNNTKNNNTILGDVYSKSLNEIIDKYKNIVNVDENNRIAVTVLEKDKEKLDPVTAIILLGLAYASWKDYQKYDVALKDVPWGERLSDFVFNTTIGSLTATAVPTAVASGSVAATFWAGYHVGTLLTGENPLYDAIENGTTKLSLEFFGEQNDAFIKTSTLVAYMVFVGGTTKLGNEF